jgi:hypothetical protein
MAYGAGRRDVLIFIDARNLSVSSSDRNLKKAIKYKGLGILRHYK